MPVKKGFDNEKYLASQTAAILERVARFDNKLYLEFGGKLLFDYHAARVLPDFDPNVKMRLLQGLQGKADIILSVSAMANPSAQMAMEKLKDLRGCEMHITHIPTPGDKAGLRRLGVNLTSDPNFSTHDLFVS
jgi:uncharacterized protein (UPF0371 family)